MTSEIASAIANPILQKLNIDYPIEYNKHRKRSEEIRSLTLHLLLF